MKAKNDKYRCKKCKEHKAAGFFYSDISRKNKLSNKCKDCVKADNKERYNRDRDKIIKKNQEYRERPDKMKTFICTQCDRSFKDLFFRKTKFCGKVCRNKSRIGNKHGYKHGHTAAMKNKKSSVISRLGYPACENCNTSNSLRWEVHHIVYRSEAPKHENINNECNLIFLCIQCHNDFHSKKSNRDGLVKERALWKLFPELKYLNL